MCRRPGGVAAPDSRTDALVHNMRVAAIERLGFGYVPWPNSGPTSSTAPTTGYGQDGAGPRQARIRRHHPGRLRAREPQQHRTRGADYAPTLVAPTRPPAGAGECGRRGCLSRAQRSRPVTSKCRCRKPWWRSCFGAPRRAQLRSGAGQGRPTRAARGPGGKPARTKDGYIAILPYTGAQGPRSSTRPGAPISRRSTGGGDRKARNASFVAMYRDLAEATRQRTTAMGGDLRCAGFPGNPDLRHRRSAEHRICTQSACSQGAVHPSEGSIRYVNPPPGLAATPAGVRLQPRWLGQHTERSCARRAMARGDLTRWNARRRVAERSCGLRQAVDGGIPTFSVLEHGPDASPRRRAPLPRDLGLGGPDLVQGLEVEEFGQRAGLGGIEVLFHQAERDAGPWARRCASAIVASTSSNPGTTRVHQTECERPGRHPKVPV